MSSDCRRPVGVRPRIRWTALLALLVPMSACLGEVSRTPYEADELPAPTGTAAEEGDGARAPDSTVEEPTVGPAGERAPALLGSRGPVAVDAHSVALGGANCDADVEFDWEDDQSLTMRFTRFAVSNPRERVSCNLAAQLTWSGDRILVIEAPAFAGNASSDGDAHVLLAGDIFTIGGNGALSAQRALDNGGFDEVFEGMRHESSCGDSATLRANLSLRADAGAATAELSMLTLSLRLLSCD